MDKKTFKKIPWILSLVVLFLVVFYTSSFVLGSNEIVLEESDFKEEDTISIASNLDSIQLAEVLAGELGWSAVQTNNFYAVYTQMKWDAFKEDFLEIFKEDFGWGELESEIFLTQSARYFAPELNFFTDLYMPGRYIIPADKTVAEVSGILITKVPQQVIREKIDKVNAQKVAELVRGEVEFLPDLVPLPAKDINIEKEANSLKLVFSTIYYNQGTGPLELVADPETEGIKEDIERDVLQRIIRKDGSVITKAVGNFLWHQEHLHYHFADFVDYILESADVDDNSKTPELKTKSTFCIRDVSIIDLELENRVEEGEYLICGKEKQGISVGWADTYFFSYVDQNFDISNLSSGTYRLTFDVNPEGIIDELNYENNKASVLLDINMEELTVEVIGEEPEDYPAVEHIHNNQVFE